MTDPLQLLSPAPKQASGLPQIRLGSVSLVHAPHELENSPVLGRLVRALQEASVEENPDLEIYFEDLEAGATNPEAYELVATGSTVRIRANGKPGYLHAAQTLLQWIAINAKNPSTPGLQVRDQPDLSERGVMLDISRDRVPTLETACQLVELLSSWKINRLQLYTEHTFAYTSAPHICSPASAWTAQEIRTLDGHAALHGIELVPNQQSFGHMHRWLLHDSHKHLSEVPEGVEHPFHSKRQPFSLCATDPKSIDFLAGLYDELLPNFQSTTFNVGLDETFDLGQGRSKSAVSERGVAAVYLDFLCAVNTLVSDRGHHMQCWADVILNHPEVVPRLPSECTPILWGYEADHPLAEESAILEASCESYLIAPGTSSWQSLGGRTDNCIANLRSAASAARNNNARGVLITDWGDRGHLQPLPVSYLGFLHGAECAWNGAAAETRTDEGLAELLDQHAFRSPSSGLGAFTLELGRASDPAGVETKNMGAIFYPIGFPERSLPDDRVPGITADGFLRSRDKVSDLQNAHKKILAPPGEAALCMDEYSWVLDLMKTSCDLGIAQASDPHAQRLEDLPAKTKIPISKSLRSLGERHADLWLIRCRPGGLSDSVSRLHDISNRLNT